MEINYEIHTIANSQGTGQERAYIQLRSKAAMTAEQLEKEIQSPCPASLHHAPDDVHPVRPERVQNQAMDNTVSCNSRRRVMLSRMNSLRFSLLSFLFLLVLNVEV